MKAEEKTWQECFMEFYKKHDLMGLNWFCKFILQLRRESYDELFSELLETISLAQVTVLVPKYLSDKVPAWTRFTLKCQFFTLHFLNTLSRGI